MNDITQIAKNAKKASIKIGKLNTEQKNRILKDMSQALDTNRTGILKANAIDIKNAKEKDLKESLIDRLMINNDRIDQMISSIKDIIDQKDHIGEIISEKTLENSIKLTEIRVGFGVIGVIYESRPNVTTDVCALSMKSSSAAILKGGSDAQNTNKAILRCLKTACPIEFAFQLIESTDRQSIKEMLKLERYIDLIIPRGGKNLIDFVRLNSKIPTIETGTGNCHIYVDKTADIKEATKIIINAKTQRPGVCNAVETIIIHKNIADNLLLKELAPQLKKHKVEIRGCKETQKIITCTPATDEDWDTEYLDLIISIKIVSDLKEAIDHINKHGTRHSESILSKDKKNIETFQNEVDAAAVYSNASTRFTDGGQFGLGAEIGISTQKMHARGPMGLKALTTTKYIITGNGQVRE